MSNFRKKEISRCIVWCKKTYSLQSHLVIFDYALLLGNFHEASMAVLNSFRLIFQQSRRQPMIARNSIEESE